MIDPFAALFKQDYKSLNMYLEHGNVNIIDKHKKTLLHYAIKLHSNEAVQILLRAYADVDIPDGKGYTSYHYAVLHNGLSYLRVFMNTEGNPMTKNYLGQTPLYLACKSGKEAMIDLFLEKYKLDMGEKDKNEETICLALVQSKNPALLKKYGGYEPWLEEPNYLGNTPLILAVHRNAGSMVAFLLEHSIFVNRKNHIGETALFYAVRNKNYEIIDLLMQKGAFLDFKNQYSETIYDFIDSEDLKDYILSRSIHYKLDTYKKKYPLHYAIYQNDPKMMQRHMTLRCLSIVDPFGYSPTDLANLYQNAIALEQLKELKRQAKIRTIETKL